MYQKLFQITLVLFLVVVSIVVLGLVISIVISVFSGNVIVQSGGGGIVMAAGRLTDRQLGYIIVAASLIVAGCYLFLRRRRFRR
jgi:hypothetical protein